LNTSTGVVKDSGQKVQQTFVAGSYSTRLIAVSKDGCIVDTTKSFKLSDKPAKPLFDGSFSVCEGGTITFTERSTETGIKKWYWDFGNKDTLTSANGSPQVKNFSNYGLITVKHVVYNDVCASDTAQQTVTIYARPALGIQYPAACLRDGVVQFKSNSTAPDGQAMKADGYAWDFGDSNATPANPDTSMLADPSHIFQYGTYTIKYSATTENGCAKDTIIKASFNLKPALLYPALPGVCQNLTGTVSVAKAVVTNGIAGIGIYRGPGTDPAGNFNPALAGVGVHTVWYVFTPTGGCTDSVSQTMTVYSQPVIDAGPSFSVPQGKLIQFYARANDSTGFRFSWSPANGLNDPTVLRPSLVVLNDQEYTLTATGPNDCKASDFLTVKVLKPVKVPNAFSPNGDGVNDRWELPNLADYLGATVQVFNRNGQAVFYSNGYSTPWDGSYNGKPLPVGTYYYIIDRKNGFMPLSGSVTLVK
jgi:gliding motility-associated-like protein